MVTFIPSGTRALRRAAGAAASLCAGVAFAQTTPPQTIPGLDGFSLPSARPTPAPSPAPTTQSRDTPAAHPTPAPRPTPTPSATPTPQPSLVPSKPVAPSATAAPRPAAVPTPTPLASSVASPDLPSPLATETLQLPPVVVPSAPQPVPDPGGAALWQRSGPIALAGLAVAVLLLAGGLGWWWRSRRVREGGDPRRGAPHEIVVLGTAEPQDAPLPAPPPVAPLAVTTVLKRATIEVDLTVKRAGTNLLSASVEYALVIRNAGAATATGVQLDLHMLSAGPDQDRILAALFEGSIEQPITPPFDLPPGDTLLLDGMVMHPKETLVVLDVPGQALFVPVLAVVVRYGWSGGEDRTARSWVVGMVRGESTRFQPFRRDGARMFETVGVLDYSIVLEG